MGDTTKISWTATYGTDGKSYPGSTLNWWIGCTKISDGCKHCYAETQDKMYRWTEGGWGPGKPRRLTSIKNRNRVLTWASEAARAGFLHRVFVSSLSDVFDAEVPKDWRQGLWEKMDEAWELSEGNIEFMVLTKRIENAVLMLPDKWLADPAGAAHIRLGVTAENQVMADCRIPILLQLWPGGKNFISAEPLLGRINFLPYMFEQMKRPTGSLGPRNPLLDVIVVGGESGAGCRPMDIEWARDILNQCHLSGSKFFMKQLGGFPKKHDEIGDWPLDLRVQEMP